MRFPQCLKPFGIRIQEISEYLPGEGVFCLSIDVRDIMTTAVYGGAGATF
jgi:hypothetical protein